MLKAPEARKVMLGSLGIMECGSAERMVSWMAIGSRSTDQRGSMPQIVGAHCSPWNSSVSVSVITLPCRSEISISEIVVAQDEVQ